MDRAAELGGDHDEVHRHIWFRRSLADTWRLRGAATAPPPPLTLVTKAAPPPEPEPAPLTGAQLLAQQPEEVQEAVKQHQQDGKWQIFKTPHHELYPYDEGQEPVVDCAPLRTTDLQLEPGETITDVASGDSERWLVTPASSGDPRNPTPHLAIKPTAGGISTNLTIYTTRHRSIPACAGEPIRASSADSRVYPRVRGGTGVVGP